MSKNLFLDAMDEYAKAAGSLGAKAREAIAAGNAADARDWTVAAVRQGAPLLTMSTVLTKIAAHAAAEQQETFGTPCKHGVPKEEPCEGCTEEAEAYDEEMDALFPYDEPG